jgi:hypothetical protein
MERHPALLDNSLPNVAAVGHRERLATAPAATPGLRIGKRGAANMP